MKVQSKPCSTCIYRKDSPLNIEVLEAAVRDPHIGFKGHRICHHSEDACCRGFWNRHRDNFPMGQIAQRMNIVEFVNVDVLSADNQAITEGIEYLKNKTASDGKGGLCGLLEGMR